MRSGVVHGAVARAHRGVVAYKQGPVKRSVASLDHVQRPRISAHDLHVLRQSVQQQVAPLTVAVCDENSGARVRGADALDGGTDFARHQLPLLLHGLGPRCKPSDAFHVQTDEVVHGSSCVAHQYNQTATVGILRAGRVGNTIKPL